MASDTFSAILGFLLQGTGNNNNTWGALLNTGDFAQIETAIAGLNAQVVTGGTLDLSGSPPPAGPSGAIAAILSFSGTLASAQSIKVPNLSKVWLVNNTCTLAGFALTFKTPSGSASAAVPVGWGLVYCDGNNNIFVGFSTSNRDVQFLAPDGTTALPGIAFGLEPSTGIRRKGTNDLVITVGGVDLIEVTGAGAGVPNVVNVLSPAVIQQAGVAIRFPGEEVDYAGLVAPVGWYFPVGQAVSRTTDAGLFGALTITATGNTHTNTTLDNLSQDLRALGLNGGFVEGTGIQTGTTITITGATTATLSLAATSSVVGGTIRVLPYGQGDAATTFNLPDRRGTVPAIRDDMGGTAAGRLTKSTTQGIDGTKLNATGGEQAHTTTLAEAPTGQLTFNFSDLGHQHTISGSAGGSNSGVVGYGTVASTANAVTSTSTSGITASITDHAGGGAHNNVQPTSICNRLIKR